jgi:hypothetical protein
MRNKPLSPWVLIVIGAVISSYAAFIREKSPDASSSMILFVYVGGVIALFGLIRLLIRVLSSSTLAKSEEKFAESFTHVPNQPAQNNNNQGPVIIYCPKCGTKNYNTSNFCHICGFKLR